MELLQDIITAVLPLVAAFAGWAAGRMKSKAQQKAGEAAGNGNVLVVVKRGCLNDSTHQVTQHGDCHYSGDAEN